MYQLKFRGTWLLEPEFGQVVNEDECSKFFLCGRKQQKYRYIQSCQKLLEEMRIIGTMEFDV